jgi:hypothetical protein
MGESRGDASRTKGRPPRRRATAPREREGGGAGTRAERRGRTSRSGRSSIRGGGSGEWIKMVSLRFGSCSPKKAIRPPDFARTSSADFAKEPIKINSFPANLYQFEHSISTPPNFNHFGAQKDLSPRNPRN